MSDQLKVGGLKATGASFSHHILEPILQTGFTSKSGPIFDPIL
jgi:hypothetical protein